MSPRPVGLRGRLAPALLAVALCFGGSAGAQFRLGVDSGRYTIRIQETEAGSDTFTADAAGGAESEITLAESGQTVHIHISVRGEAGRLRSFETDARAAGTFLLQVGKPEATLTVGDASAGAVRSKPIALPNRLFPYCTTAPEQLRMALAAYDIRLGGPQAFPVAYTNRLRAASLIEGTLTLIPNGFVMASVSGQTEAVARFRCLVPTPIGQVAADLYADADGRVLLFRMPDQKLSVIRDGFKELEKPLPPTDPGLSVPAYPVRTETNVRIPMRDGVTLAADITRPDVAGKFPVILQRTCTGRHAAVDAGEYARRGYVYIAQDVRGKFDSEGEWTPYIHEAADGGDTVEWCARQPWSNGRIGMIGEDYAAFTQWAAARENSRNIGCLVPIASPADPTAAGPYRSGVFALERSLRWASVEEGRFWNRLDPPRDLAATATLPVTEVDRALFGHHIGFLQEWLLHPIDDTYWAPADINRHMRGMPQIPALHVGGWFDDNASGTQRNYATMAGSGHKNQHLVLGPWDRAVNLPLRVGPTDFGAAALIDLDTLTLRWFDHWLKGVENGVDREAPVQAFLTGINQWRMFAAWPPKQTKPMRLYLGAEGGLRLLSATPPDTDGQESRFRFDPLHPYLSQQERTGANAAGAEGADGLRFTSEAQGQEMTITGPVSLTLETKSTAPDTDWYAALQDLAPNGSATLLTEGIAMAGINSSRAKRSSPAPEEFAKLTIDLSAVGHVLPKGHRLSLLLTSSSFPRFARSLNTGDDLTTARSAPAQQTVAHSQTKPSYLTIFTEPR